MAAADPKHLYSANHIYPDNVSGIYIYIYTHTSSYTLSSSSSLCPRHMLSASSPIIVSSSRSSLYFGGRRHPNILSFRFRLNYTCGVFRSLHLYGLGGFRPVGAFSRPINPNPKQATITSRNPVVNTEPGGVPARMAVFKAWKVEGLGFRV